MGLNKLPGLGDTENNELAEAEKFFSKENFVLNGREVEILGVVHTRMTIMSMFEEIEAAVKRAGIVVVEMGPDIENIERFLGDGLDDENRRFLGFFEYVSNLAGRQGKTVVNADAYSGAQDEKFFEDVDSLAARDQKVLIAKSLLAPAFLFGAASLVRDQVRKQFSRRKFLLGAAGLAVGTVPALSLIGQNVGYTILAGREGNPLHPLLYDLMDYRNVISWISFR